jgi:hypothetical protein
MQFFLLACTIGLNLEYKAVIVDPPSYKRLSGAVVRYEQQGLFLRFEGAHLLSCERF